MSRTKALTHFHKVDKRFHKATLPHHKHLPTKLAAKKSPELFSALCSIVISQQLGTAAADTIFARVRAACGGKLSPANVLKVSPAKLRAAGLSGSKSKTLKEIAKEVKSGKLKLEALRSMPEEEAKTRLIQIWGVGPWSAEMYLIFALGRDDVFSPGDLGLARAIETIYKLPKNAPQEKLLLISKRWAPYRSWAALALWRTRDVKIADTPPLPRPKLKGRHRN